MARAKPKDRKDWLMRQLQPDPARAGYSRHYSLNVLDRDLVDAYIVEFPDVTVKFKVVGSHYVPSMARELRELFDEGRLQRHASGIGDGLSGQGFPKWVWDYRLPAAKN